MKSRAIVYILALLLGTWSLFPIYWVLNLSLQFRFQIYSLPANLFPSTPTLAAYLRAFGFPARDPFVLLPASPIAPFFLQGLRNSLIVSIPVTLLTIVVAIPAGYALARAKFPFKRELLLLLVLTLGVSPASIAIPYYPFFVASGLYGTQLGLILIDLVLTVPLTTWLLTGFFIALPAELENQARTDGCSRSQLIWRLVLPLVRPGIAVAAIFSFLISWNEFTLAVIFTVSTSAQTLPLALSSVLGYGAGAIEVLAAIAIVSIIPSMIGAYVIQRFIVNMRLTTTVFKLDDMI